MFIGGMKDGTSEDDIREVFEEYGKIAKVEMVTDKATGKQKSFCFVEFEDYDPVDKCVCKYSIKIMYINQKFCLFKIRCGIIANETSLHKRPKWHSN